MPSLALIERHIRILIKQDVANIERIRAMLPPAATEAKPAPRKRAAKTATKPADAPDVIDITTLTEPNATMTQPAVSTAPAAEG